MYGVDWEDHAYQLQRRTELLEELVALMTNVLTYRECCVLINHYGIGPDAEPQNFAKIAKAMGVKRETVRTAHNIAIRKLRKHKHILQEFL